MKCPVCGNVAWMRGSYVDENSRSVYCKKCKKIYRFSCVYLPQRIVEAAINCLYEKIENDGDSLKVLTYVREQRSRYQDRLRRCMKEGDHDAMPWFDEIVKDTNRLFRNKTQLKSLKLFDKVKKEIEDEVH